MSTKYPGGIITKNYTAPTPTSASGIWTLEQQEQAQQAGIWPYGGPFTYIEDVFSTYLYTGTGANQTITNGIDLSTYGGLVWTKRRNVSSDHKLIDSARGWTVGSGVGQASPVLKSNLTDAQAVDTSGTSGPYDITSVSTTGYSIGPDWNGNGNTNTGTYASWTFRKHPKFFDVQTFTTTYNSNPNVISFNLTGELGCAIFKQLNTTGQGINWIVYHRSLGTGKYLVLNSTGAQIADAQSFTAVNNTAHTISFGYPMANLNDRLVVGNTTPTSWVGYFFAHNAGGFGLTNTDNVISCGSFTSTGTTTQSVNLGYEVQCILAKRTDVAGSWLIFDNMRGTSVASNTPLLIPNATTAESSSFIYASSTATGFDFTNFTAGTYIYIAIRRGPMKVPTDPTKVFAPATFTAADQLTTAGFVVDTAIEFENINTSNLQYFSSRLTAPNSLNSRNTAVEVAQTQNWASNTQVQLSNQGNSYPRVYEMFQRAPGFHDVVCDTGTGSVHTVNHNLGAVPTFIIRKNRSGTTENWIVSCAYDGFSGNADMRLNQTSGAGSADSTLWNSTAPTSSVFTVGTAASTNASGKNYVTYLFATCPGVSKVGSYSGTGATQTIDCGFTGGARWLMVKRIDTTGDWYLWDTARGMVAGTDPYLLMNSTAAQVNANNIYTTAVGFQIVGTGAGINASGGTYIYLAIA